jgi:hypothetical protein
MSESHSEGIQSTPGHESAHGIQTGHGHDHGGHAPAAVPFSTAQIADFQREDRYAGGAIVVLMTSIFSLGIVLYTIVLLSCIY